MGQYWYVVNLDKREFINPHDLGAGLKLCEQLGTYPGTGAALIVLCAAMPEARGGGDFDMDKNWHGPERKFPEHNVEPGPMPEEYPAIARRTIGRWAGNRIALVGDYAERGDLLDEFQAENIYEMCEERKWLNVSADVAAVIEHELNGKYEGDGWRRWKENEPLAEEVKSEARPKLKLVGTDGNAFAVLGAAMKAARKAGWSKEQMGAFQVEATSGDYNALLATCQKWFDVE